MIKNVKGLIHSFPYALVVGMSAISFQILMEHWFSVAFGATVFNHLAILLVTYLFWGIGAFWSINKEIRLKTLLFILVALFSLIAITWPEAPLYLSTKIRSHTLRFFCAILIMSPISFLLGLILPAYNKQEKNKETKTFKNLYTWFHLGAAGFLFFLEFYLIFNLGIRNLFWICSVIIILPFIMATNEKKGERQCAFYWDEPLFVYSFINGLVQGFLIRLNTHVQGPFSETFTLYIISSLLGLALASQISKNKQIDREFIKNKYIVLISGGILWCLLVSLLLPNFYGVFDTSNISLIKSARAVGSLIIFLPLHVLMGFLVPVFYRKEKAEGVVLSINSWGNVLGLSFVVMFLTLFSNIKVLVILIFALLILYSYRLAKAKSTRAILVSMFCLMFILLIPETFFHLSYRHFENGKIFLKNFKSAKLLKSENFLGAQVDIVELSGKKTLIIDGYKSIMLDLDGSFNESEILLGTLQEFIVRNKESALVLGVGSGATVFGNSKYFQKVVGVEIHPVIMELQDYFSPYNFNLKKLENVTLAFDDGFSYLNNHEEKYDLIVNNVPTPQYSPSSLLWTVETLNLIKNRLNDDGVYSQWIDGAINAEAINVIMATLQQAFSNCYLGVITSTYGNIFCLKNSNAEPLIKNGLIFKINEFDKINFNKPPNTIDRSLLKEALSPFLSKSWLDKKAWFLLDLLKISPKKEKGFHCDALSKVKNLKGRGLPQFCVQ